MKHVEGVYKVEMLGPYGWENFSTAFVHGGEFRSASAKHFTAGTYHVEGEEFSMTGNMTRYVDDVTLFGQKGAKGLPVRFRGTIEENVIDGEAQTEDPGKYSIRFRLSKLPMLN